MKFPMVTFHANCIAVEEMDDFLLVGFADEEFETRSFLTLQRSFEDDEQDIEQGIDTYYVERDDQSLSCYGGIERFELLGDRVVVQFTQVGAERVRTHGMEITFHVDQGTLQGLAASLTRIFVGTDCLAIHA